VIEAGSAVAELHAPREDDERQRALVRAEGYRRAAGGAAGLDHEGAARQMMAERERQRWAAEAGARAAELARLRVVAERGGQVADVDPLLAAGTWVDASTPMAWVVRPGAWQAEALVAEVDLPRLRPQGRATVIIAGTGARLDGRIASIDAARTQRLPHQLLASPRGGPVAVHPADRHGGMPPVDALYRVLIEGEGNPPGRLAVRRATVHLEAEPASPGLRWLAAMTSALVRQGNF